jgi:hypothetical protein
VERTSQFIEWLNQYRDTIHALSSRLDAYAVAGQSIPALGRDLEGSAGQYFEVAASLTTLIEETGRDANGANVLLAMIGVDMMVMRQAALTAWFTDEEDGETPQLRADQLDELHPDLIQSTELLLAEIAGTSPPAVAGASAEAAMTPEVTVRPSVERIVSTTGDDLQKILEMGGVGLLAAIAGSAHHIWAAASPEIDRLFRSRRLRWLAAKAVEAARKKLISLSAIGGDQKLPDLLSEFADYARKAVTRFGLAAGIGKVFDVDSTVAKCDRRLQVPAGAAAVLAAEKVAADHKRWRHWVPRAAIGGRVAFAVIPTALFPAGAPTLLAIAVILIVIELWAAGAYLSSSRLPKTLRFGVLGIPDAIDQALPRSSRKHFVLE